MLELTFYGGVRQIGGTKILLRTNEGSLFVDFGKDFELEGAYFEEPWNPPFHIQSLKTIGALPDIAGLYRIDPGRPVDGVLISHAHLDHCGGVPLLSPRIPVYAGQDTKELILIRTETYDRGWTNDYGQTDWKTFRSGDVVHVPGTDIRFMPVHVDHSVPASYGFIIEADGRKIAYTGDLRMHGRYPRMTEDFLKALRMNGIDTLICEGTHVTAEGADPEAQLVAHMQAVSRQRMGEAAPRAITIPCATEDSVEANLRGIVRSSKGLVLVEVAPIDLDRVLSVCRAARAGGRIPVLPARLAYIVLQARRRTGIQGLPEVGGAGLYLSQLKKRADRRAVHDPLDAEEFIIGRRGWEQQLARDWTRAGGLVFGLPQGRDALLGNSHRFVICSPNASTILPELSYGDAVCPLTFVLSKSGPFHPDMAVSFDRLLHWLSLFGCRSYYHLHVSGHAPPRDIAKVINAANPRMVIPIHTHHPRMFDGWHDRVVADLELGQPLKFM